MAVIMMEQKTVDLEALRAAFGEWLQTSVPMARYTTAHVGGPAQALLVANTANNLAEIVRRLCEMSIPHRVLGSGSNVLVSDAGISAYVIVHNRARQYHFRDREEPPLVWAESGVNFGALARQAAARGLSGLEWASGIPGTIGGAVVGNAGAHGSDMSTNLVMAEILHHVPGGGCQHETWPLEKMEYAYRSSILKQSPERGVVLAAMLGLSRSTPEAVQAKIDTYTAYRHRTQPPGASMGSMFKNPPGDYAGRLIDAAGLKGTRVGDAQISPLHGNFFVNLGQATATELYTLIDQARGRVQQEFGVTLELEIELLGDW
ncbi:MAG: UDP-N-acetylmuramate dehydrogenase [Anaerolineales bacterium]|nr:UDP-N-acetylmuramate dehydrogenase [Anaerolineales bacterium]